MQLRQLSPLSPGHLSQLSAFGDWRGGSPECSEDVNLFRSWFLYDSGLKLMGGVPRTNWNAVVGIVLASVAFDAGIISPQFYTTLVIAAVVTSQFAGAWLDFVLRKGWPLLSSAPELNPETASQETPAAA